MFQKSVLKNTNQDESLVASRWAEYQKYLKKIDYIKKVKEEKFQTEFLQLIFENCLGYTLDSTNPNDFNLEREKKNETDSKKADGVISVNNEVVGVVELKGQDTKNLDKIEAQAFNYHNSHSNSKYIIISNFDELRLYIDKKTAYERFSLFHLTYEEFKKFHLLLSYESIKKGMPLTLKEQSASFEQDISNKLYKDFSLFRTHLFENLVKNNSLDKALLLRLTQKLCDRIIFILFAEDRGLLTPNTIKEIREEFSNQKFTSHPLYDIYKFYFDAINKGNEKLNIPKYNGGLFAQDKALDSLVIDDNILDSEVQRLSNYDFMSDVDVNILGHIFEQSLTDLEEINASINEVKFDSKKSKRKKDGVFYTPKYITSYIVQNTLGKLCIDKREELQIGSETIVPPKNPKKPTKKEQELKENLETYRNWLLNLKILDPACGSGAFLNQALDFLINEHQSLQKDLVVMGDITTYYEIEKSILENNLYGVDINEDAVEIAKLSLWLRTA
ncbi:MAG: N-6 DNA methylase, partial [Sulfurospirillum sp.]|nr:N-6 DNA methylase [Sulfurospirillum sp.]